MIFLTEIITEDGTIWEGDRIEAISIRHAEHILRETGRGYMKVIGLLSRDIDENGNLIIDYDLLMAN